MASPAPSTAGPAHRRWARTGESPDYFRDVDRLVAAYYAILAGGCALLAGLAFGLWRLQAAARAAPIVVGIAHGWVFTGQPETLASVRDRDFAPQLADTVEVLFGRTEKGLPPAIKDFATPEVIAGIGQAYGEAASKYPAGYAQTLAIEGSRVIESRTGFQHVHYHGLLSSRSLSAAQMSPVYLDCTFVIGSPTPRNAAGWRLIRVAALSADDYYAAERERAARQALQLPPVPAP
jgi:hypothetical protein